MATTTLHLTLPVRLPSETGVHAKLHSEPADAQRDELNSIGFWRLGYPDERLGRIRQLDDAVQCAEAAGNPFWKVTVIGEAAGDVVGELLDHARIYIPDASGARLMGRAAVPSGAEARKLDVDWVSWVLLTVRVSH